MCVWLGHWWDGKRPHAWLNGAWFLCGFLLQRITKVSILLRMKSNGDVQTLIFNGNSISTELSMSVNLRTDKTPRVHWAMRIWRCTLAVQHIPCWAHFQSVSPFNASENCRISLLGECSSGKITHRITLIAFAALFDNLSLFSSMHIHSLRQKTMKLSLLMI